MEEEFYYIECNTCDNWESFPADMPRKKAQTFKYLRPNGDSGVYQCECDNVVNSKIIKEE
jgi:hypothetical protein